MNINPTDQLIETAELLVMADDSLLLLRQLEFLAPAQRKAIANIRKLVSMAGKKVSLVAIELNKPDPAMVHDIMMGRIMTPKGNDHEAI